MSFLEQPLASKEEPEDIAEAMMTAGHELSFGDAPVDVAAPLMKKKLSEDRF